MPEDMAWPDLVVLGTDGQEQPDPMRRRTFLVGGVATLAVPTSTAVAARRPVAIRCDDHLGFASTMTDRWPTTNLSRVIPSNGVDWRIQLPAGRMFGGSELVTQVHQAAAQPGSAALIRAEPRALEQLTRPRQRALLIAADPTAEDGVYYAIDAHKATRQTAGRTPDATIAIPRAYLLDDLTYGAMWALANLDDALLADDGALHAYRQDLAHYEGLSGSAAPREEAPELGTLAQSWLGSEFCARHIVRHLDQLDASPLFWTREQRGEEASTWLLWRHKVAYLQRTSGFGTPIARGFCLPEHLVDESPRHERVLLLLSAALMESMGIHVCVTPEPDYGDVEGFVLGGTVIVANWIRTPGLWQVDTRTPSSQSRFNETAGEVSAHSAIDGPTPRRRLMALAAYLRIPWHWFHARCAELGTVGFAGLTAPRSRLLSVDGLDRACRYVGQLTNS